jgi:hypothetical protein
MGNQQTKEEKRMKQIRATVTRLLKERREEIKHHQALYWAQDFQLMRCGPKEEFEHRECESFEKWMPRMRGFRISHVQGSHSIPGDLDDHVFGATDVSVPSHIYVRR